MQPPIRQRAFFDQGPLKLRDGHQSSELELTDRILLGRIDALARANRCDVSHLKFTDADRERGQTAAQAIKLVGSNPMDAAALV